MSFEHPNRNNESMIDVERDIMSRPSERNTTNLDLQRMKMILDIMGHPEQSFRVIHITGTNGKGSTARMAEAICRAYGMRTGLYTSPHLEHVNERIAIDGQQLSDDDFVDTWDQVKDLVAIVDMKMDELGKPKMSFFEVLTAMAIWKFADAPVDVAIVEVGMGGRWDATNVLDADAAIIGPVDMDHMAWLGDTVEEITTEKVGIIKPNCTAIIGRQPHEDEVMPIIEPRPRRTTPAWCATASNRKSLPECRPSAARWPPCAPRTAPTRKCRSPNSASIRHTTRSPHCARRKW